VLEALATGRPVITTDAPGCRETLFDLGPPDDAGIRTAANGLAVPVAHSQALAVAMGRLATPDAPLDQFAAYARHHAEQKYDVRKVNATLVSAFAS
jgi:glycosyltransferase involved in cell wall biosynthesis